MAGIANSESEVHGEKRVSLVHTFVFSLICLFFTFVAVFWELKHRLRFKKAVKLRRLSSQEIEATLDDFERLKTCQNPFVEDFQDKHAQFASVNRLWLINSCNYWCGHFERELKRRGHRIDQLS
jgi:hypothetical protein